MEACLAEVGVSLEVNKGTVTSLTGDFLFSFSFAEAAAKADVCYPGVSTDWGPICLHSLISCQSEPLPSEEEVQLSQLSVEDWLDLISGKTTPEPNLFDPFSSTVPF